MADQGLIGARVLLAQNGIAVFGIEALFKEAGSIFCIEWPERIQALIPEDALVMEIEIKNGEEREIRYGG